ncbi:hypothetical protein GcM3_099017 [Golovinomyces cichoracearum]|uniref:Uncharacterized protein n=1 Tax=Golovinomyces cichoracearum TaxID=62708 RepID=A0A420IC49_9PEZI|nr:hypothetical protein GcM3_099017 [Golovinomyces cichoracearum]
MDPEDTTKKIERLKVSSKLKNISTESLTKKKSICKGLDPENIISGTRRTHYGGQFVSQVHDSLHSYYLSFCTAKMETSFRHHPDNLPPVPIRWSQMLRHKFRKEFKIAAEKEFHTLKSKNTWEFVEEIQNANLIPLIWIFDYKYDVDGYLAKFKARICARGDLQYFDEETCA